VAPIEVMAVIQYGQHYSFASGWMKVNGGQNVLTASGIVAAVVLMAIFTAINFLSVRKLANTNSTATWWKVGVPLLTIVVLAIVSFHPGNFTAADGFAPSGASGILAAASTSGIIFAVLGFEQADQLAGESANPKRDIPRAVIGAITLGVIVYILLQIVFLMALPASHNGGTWAHSPYTTFSGPFAQLATLAGVGWLASILYIDAVISPGGTGLIYTTAASRVSYGLSRNGYVPTVYERTDRRGIPWFGLLTAFVVGCICFLPFPSWRSLVGLITSASVLMYAGAPLALGALRARLPDAERPYRARAARMLAPLAFAVANLLILWSGWTTDWKLGCRDPDRLRDPWFPLWWDMLAVAAFSLAIYFWAQHVALPADKIERLASRGAVVEEPVATTGRHRATRSGSASIRATETLIAPHRPFMRHGCNPRSERSRRRNANSGARGGRGPGRRSSRGAPRRAARQASRGGRGDLRLAAGASRCLRSLRPGRDLRGMGQAGSGGDLPAARPGLPARADLYVGRRLLAGAVRLLPAAGGRSVPHVAARHCTVVGHLDRELRRRVAHASGD